MPIGFNSPARNFFLLGSSGVQVATNFFKTIDQSATTDGFFSANGIKYSSYDEKYILAGSAENSQSISFGYLEKREEDGTLDWNNRIQSSLISGKLDLTSLELDTNGDLIVGGLSNSAPWIAKYSNTGGLVWLSTTNTGDARYFGIGIDSSNNYYAAGRTERNDLSNPNDTNRSNAILEKYDSNGNASWGKSVSIGAENASFQKVDVSDTSVICAGYIEDDVTKGYFAKYDSVSGVLQWDRTLESKEISGLGVQEKTSIEDIHVDADGFIYLCGVLSFGEVESNTFNQSRGFITKYTPEGNQLWCREVGIPNFTAYVQYYNIKVDDNTKQVIVFGIKSNTNNTKAGLLTKLSSSGEVLWHRQLSSDRVPPTLNEFQRRVGFDADASFYYIFFTDDDFNKSAGTPDEYTFGKVSSSGNGLGSFVYNPDPLAGIDIEYTISSIPNRIGKLQDGSVRNDSSDFISYPFNGTKIMFDDLATPVTNKKAIISDKDIILRSGSPAIRVADFQELNLLGDAGIPKIPVELITNGDFENSDTTGWTIGPNLFTSFNSSYGSVALIISNYGGVASNVYQSFPTEIGAKYNVSLDQQGGPVIKIFNGSGISGTTLQTITTSTSGNFETGETGTFIATSTTSTIAVADIPSGGGYLVDNFSVKIDLGIPEILDVLGPNLIINGDFEGDNIEGWFLDQNGGNVIDFYSSGYTGSRSLSLQNLGGSGNPNFYQSFATTPGRTYRITLQQSGSPTFTIFDGSGVSGATLKTMTTTNPTGSVAFEEEAYFTASSTTSTFAFASFGSGAYLMDDISVRETPILWGDQSGKGNRAAILGATHNANGYWEFDGTDDKIIGPPCNTILSADSSIELWVNFDDVTTRQTIISGYDSTPNTDPNRWDFEMSAGTFRGGFHDNGYFTSSTAISIGVWNHVMLVLNSSTNSLRFYLNGVLDKSQSCSGFNFGGPDINLSIGNRNESVVGPMDGKIGEVRIYPRALTPAQVFQNYNATKTKFIYEAPDTAPKIGASDIVYGSNLLLNYDFGNRATYDSAATVNVGENRYTSSSNLLNFSDETPIGRLTDWSWLFSTPPTITPNAAIAPDGSLTAFKLSANSLYQSVINDGDFTISAWVKTVDGSSASVTQSVYLLNTGGELLYTTHTATGDWQRFTFSGVATSEYGSPAGEYHRYTPFASASELYVWGPQVELKSSANSYVPTYGTAAIPGVSRLPNTVKNLSSNSFPGTISSALYNDGGWFEFTGPTSSSTRISFDSSSVDLSGSFSIDMWFRQNDQSTYHMLLGAEGYGVGTSNGIGHYLYQNTIRTWVKEGTYINLWDSAGTTTLTQNVWYNLILIRESGTAWRWYLNGSLVNSNTTDSLTTDFTTPNTYIGDHYNTAVFHFDGDIGALRMYSRALSSTEVSQNFNATRGKYGV